RYIEVAYSVDDMEYGFKVGCYDKNLPLVIDPLLASTYLGGSGTEGGDAYWWIWTALGPDDAVYVAGMTESSDFPTIPGAYEDERKGNYDLFISKLSNDLSTLEASTFLGGSGFDQIWSLVAGDNGNVYISGITHSSNFPHTSGAYDSTISGTTDGFISILSGDLSTLQASTYLGGTGYEFRVAAALDDNNNIFVVGMTNNGTFPKTSGVIDEDYNGDWDFFVSKFNSDLTSLLASTFLGGTYREDYPDIAIDNSNNVYVGGTTGSDNYPTTTGAYNTEINGTPGNDWANLDVCVSKLSNDLTILLASTFYGADDYESGLHLCLDEESNVYTYGHTWDSNFPVSSGVIDEGFSGDEYHITKFNADLSNCLAATFLTPEDAGLGYISDIKSDRNGNICIIGSTASENYPATDNAFDNNYNGGLGDGFLMKITDDLSEILYSTFLGGSGKERACSIAIDKKGDAIIAGFTNSSIDFPITANAADDDYNGGESDCFVSKFTFDQFTRITEGPHVTDTASTSSISWIDYDNDDYPDIFLSMWDVSNRLYRNNGDGTFSEATGYVFLDEGSSTASCWADYDNDGDMDAYIAKGMHENIPNNYYLNNGNDSFTKITTGIIAIDSAASMAIACADYNNDAALDLFTPAWMFTGPCNDQLYQGVGDGTFTKITDSPIDDDVTTSGETIWTDIGGDGDQDLIVRKTGTFISDILFENNDGEFTAVTGLNYLTLEGSQNYDFGDFDNDGDQDLFIPTWYGYNNALFENTGGGTFVQVTGQPITDENHWSTSSCSGDFDNDGDLDIFLINDDKLTEDQPDYFYLNDGTGTFTPYVDSSLIDNTGQLSCKVSYADYDRDGDLDLYLSNWYYEEPNIQLRNNGNGNNWLIVKLIGIQSNISGIGAKVRVLADINGSPVWQMRELRSHISSLAQGSSELHFGLGDATIVDSIKVEWPSGMVNALSDVSVNQFLVITEMMCGDANGDGDVNVGDAVYIISHVFKGGPAPEPIESGDANCDGNSNIGDAVYLINHVFKGGPGPCEGCE
ncbi:MAG: FG-GAP-like repeat-containing protein, partial [candidate division Zixibacteria bacterium]